MTLADIKNYAYRRTKTNSTTYPAADMLIAVNNARQRVESLIRANFDNFLASDWDSSALSTGTAVPWFDQNYHELIPLWITYDYFVDSGLEGANGILETIRVKEKGLTDFYGNRNYRIFTVTLASPGVFTSKDHGLSSGDRVLLTTTGALPTGLTANSWYYVISAGLDDDNFQVSSTKDGTAVNTSTSQSGTHYFASDLPKRMGIRSNGGGSASGILGGQGSDSGR